MLNTFENTERQHLRRKERERNLEMIQNIGRDPLFLYLEEKNLAPAADALIGTSLAKLPPPNEQHARELNLKRARRKLILGICGIVIGIILVAVLSAFVRRPGPGTPRIGDSTIQRYNHLFSLVLDWGLTERAALETNNTAQSNALNWLAFRDTTYSDYEILRTRFALATLFFSTRVSSSWYNENNWLSSNPVCLWYGVECLDEPGMVGLVQSINLTANGLEGVLPRELALLQLNCRSIDLSYNSIGGAVIDLAPMKNLQQLYLGPNFFVSTIPSSIYQLSHLTHLYLNDCILTGGIDSAIGGLTNLQGLGLHNNALRGSIPQSISKLSDLRVLYLDGNLLSSSIPDQLPSGLIDLRLGNNLLTSTIPESIGHAKYLQILYLDNNLLNGPIPASTLASLPLMLEVQLHKNLLTGYLPNDLSTMALLSVFYVDGNLIRGKIHEMEQHKFLRSFYLFDNAITGNIPTSIGACVRLRHLRLNNNDLTGELPSELGMLTELTTFYADNNRLSGVIPPEIGSLGSLRQIRFNGNDFTGEVPSELCGTDLVELTADCDDNMLCECCTQCYH